MNLTVDASVKVTDIFFLLISNLESRVKNQNKKLADAIAK